VVLDEREVMNTRPFAMPILATLLAVLTLASSAWAECACVLWQGVMATNDPLVEEWAVVLAAPTMQECNKNIAPAVQQKAAVLTTSKVEGNQVVWEMINKKTLVWRYVCLPDAVDPRGPKGSGR
jgi:hypothetical protein